MQNNYNKISEADKAKMWQCSKCLKKFPVPSLARECEVKHRKF